MPQPTIIQTPGALDEARAAFMQSYVTARQLAMQRQQLQAELAKAQSQIGLQGAEASEAKARTATLQDQLQQNEWDRQGASAAAGLIAHMNDPQAVSTALGNLSDDVRPFALKHLDMLRQTAADLEKTKAATAQMQAEADAMGRKALVNAAIGNVLASHRGQLGTLDGVQNMLVDAAKVDPDAARTLAATFVPQMEGNWEQVIGNDGRLILVERKKGTVRDTGVNVGPKAAGTGGVTTQEMQFTAQQALTEINNIMTLARQNPTSAVVPRKSAAAAGIARITVPGVGPVFGGVAGPVAQAALSPEQQVFQRHVTSFLHLYGALLPRSRNTQALLENFKQSFSMQAGQDLAKNLPDLMRTWLRLRAGISALAQGRQVDMTTLPLFNEAAQGAAAEAPSADGGGALNYGSYRDSVPK